MTALVGNTFDLESLVLLGTMAEVTLDAKEVREMGRMERIGAHSHIRGALLFIQFQPP